MAAWPTGNDLAEWLGGQASAGRRAGYDEDVEAAIDVAWGDLDPAKMPDQTGDEATRCPAGVRSAVLILAAKIGTRRQSTNGVIASGDIFFRVSREDPDYLALISRYAVSAEP